MCYSFQDVDPESVLHFILVCPNSFEAAFTADIDVKPVGGDPQVVRSEAPVASEHFMK